MVVFVVYGKRNGLVLFLVGVVLVVDLLLVLHLGFLLEVDLKLFDRLLVRVLSDQVLIVVQIYLVAAVFVVTTLRRKLQVTSWEKLFLLLIALSVMKEI